MSPVPIRGRGENSCRANTETRNPKAERRPKAEARFSTRWFVLRISDFGLPSAFGLRVSTLFRFLCLTPLLLTIVGCLKPQGTVLGRAPKGDVSTILAIRAGDTPPHVTLSGVMVEKCPVAGCWLRVRDRTGVIKVDTKSAGFVVVNVPLDTKVTVAGKIVMDGDEAVL